MGKLNMVASGLTVVNSMNVISIINQLKKKKDLTDFEKKALNSINKLFKSWFAVVMFYLIISCIVFIFIGFNSMPDYSARRYGVVEDGKIKYVQNVVVYKTFEELDLEKYSNSKEGEKFILFFDNFDNYQTGMSMDDYDKLSFKTFVPMIGCLLSGIILLPIILIIFSKTIGKDFNIYYTLLDKRKNDSIWLSDDRTVMYEDYYCICKKDLWRELFYVIICLLFIISIGFVGVLVIGKIYSLIPDIRFINITRFIGIFLMILVVVIFVVFTNIYYNKIMCLYSDNRDVKNTRLLKKNDNGSIGYFKNGVWCQLIKLVVCAEDDKMIRAICFYKNSSNNQEFKEINCFLKEDYIYNDIINLDNFSKSILKGSFKWFFFVILFFIVVMIVSCYLIGIRDYNIINF